MQKEIAQIYRADVYFNLHSKLWSIKDRKTGLVCAHAPVVVFAYPTTFVVSEAGRQRVLREKRKNVHAYVRGVSPVASPDVVRWEEFLGTLQTVVPVSYNPYKGAAFYRKDTGADITKADSVIMLAAEGKPPRVFALGAE